MPTFATRPSLLSKLRDWQDDRSWRQFFDTYWKLIASTARQAGLSSTEAEDVAQETLLAVARRMPGFKYDPALGSFRGWLRLITQRRITDHFRRRQRDLPRAPARPTDQTEEQIADPAGCDPGQAWDAAWEKTVLGAALQEARRTVDPKQFQIFDCYVLKGWPVKDVVRTLQVSPTQVYLAKHRMVTLLQKIAERLARQESQSMGG